MSSSNKVFKLQIHAEVDQDVDQWLNSLPKKKKSDIVKHAIRYYVNELEDGELIKPLNTSNDLEAPKKEKPKEKVKPAFTLSDLK